MQKAVTFKQTLQDISVSIPIRVCEMGQNIYSQDILDDLESECLLFADGTCLFAFGEDPASLLSSSIEI